MLMLENRALVVIEETTDEIVVIVSDTEIGNAVTEGSEQIEESAEIVEIVEIEQSEESAEDRGLHTTVPRAVRAR